MVLVNGFPFNPEKQIKDYFLGDNLFYAPNICQVISTWQVTNSPLIVKSVLSDSCKNNWPVSVWPLTKTGRATHIKDNDSRKYTADGGDSVALENGIRITTFRTFIPSTEEDVQTSKARTASSASSAAAEFFAIDCRRRDKWWRCGIFR